MDSKREPLGRVDAAWLRMDEPDNLMVVNSILVLQQPVPFERYRDLVASRLDVLPRLRQRVVTSGTSPGALVWDADPHFDLSYHVLATPLERPDEPSLQNLVGRLMIEPLDPLRPPWRIYFVPQYEDGSAVIWRSHHCIGDGPALLYVLLMLTDEPPVERAKAPLAPQPQASRGLLMRLLSPLVFFARSVAASVAHTAKDIIALPARALHAVRIFLLGVRAAGKLLLMRPVSRSLLKGPMSQQKHAVWSRPIPVGMVKEITRMTGSTINDVALAAVAGGLRRYLLSRGQKVNRLRQRAVVPVDLRPVDEASELGNRFGLVFVTLPLGIADPLERVFAVRNQTRKIKRSPESLLTFLILWFVGRAPTWFFNFVVNFFGHRSTVVITNVLGPRHPLRMAGTTLKRVDFWVPCAGHLGIGFSIFSYSGSVWLGLATDGNQVSDPEVIIEGFESEMAALFDVARQARPEQPAAPIEIPTEPAQRPPTLAQRPV